MKKANVTETVLFYDTDCGGVVSNIAYLRFVEKARISLFESLGMDLASMSETQLFPAVLRTEIDYRLAARLGQTLKIAGWLRRVEKVRVVCEFRIALEEPEERIVAEARQVVALVQMPEARPRRVPPEWFRLTE